MSVSSLPPQPLAAAVKGARSLLDDVRGVQPLYLAEPEKEQLLLDLARLEAAVVSLRLRTMAVAGDVADEHGARDVAAWLAHASGRDPVRVRAEQTLATALEERFTATGAALAAGAVNLEQARVIVEACADLPTQVGAEVVARAEADLIGYAAEFGPVELRRLGRRILHVCAPDIADAEDAKRLEALEAAAFAKTSVRFRPTGVGSTRVSMMLPDADAARLATYLDAFTNPRHRDRQHETAENPDLERLPLRHRRGQAFCGLLQHLDPSVLPVHGGTATTVTVTMTLTELVTGLGAATLDTPLSVDGQVELSPAQARRLACEADLVPVVLGGASEVLDVGRAQRLFTAAIRRAMRVRDKTCRAEGCGIPVRWTEAHHLTPWSHGGATSLANAISLCSFHHHRIHDHSYAHDRLANGDVRFHRRR